MWRPASWLPTACQQERLSTKQTVASLNLLHAWGSAEASNPAHGALSLTHGTHVCTIARADRFGALHDKRST